MEGAESGERAKQEFLSNSQRKIMTFQVFTLAEVILCPIVIKGVSYEAGC